MSLGPLHILVFGFDEPNFTGAALAELRRLEENELVRLVDLLFVQKGLDGSITAIEVEDLDPATAGELGDLAAAFVGLGAEPEDTGDVDDELWDVAEDIPAGTAAAVVLLEHRWAVGLQGAIAAAGGRLIGDALVPTEDIASLGDDFDAALRARS